MTAAARTYTPLWPLLEPRIVAAQPSGQLPKPNGNGWIGGIFSPLRQEDKPSFSVKPDSPSDPGGFEDHGTGESGSMSKLAQLLQVDPHVSSSPASSTPQTFSTFCATRKLDPDILTKTWGVHQVQWHDKRAQRTRPALRYPTELGIDRIKYLDKGPKLEKYTWAAQGGSRHWYGLKTALQLSGPLYLVKGEPSVWAAQQEGVAAICLCGGEGAAPTPELVASLLAAGVTEIRVIYDLDDKGRAGAPKTVAALEAGAIDATAYELPSFLGAGGDVDDLHQWEGLALGAALARLPPLQTQSSPGAGAPTTPTPTIFKFSELLARTFDARRDVVPGLLPEGLTLFGGKAKSGKSWIVLDLSLAIASGGYAFGKYKVEQGDVLYLALEDNDRRLQSRALKLLEGQDLQCDFDLATEWPRLDMGGLTALESWLQAHPQRRLLVVDTYIKIRPLRKPGCDIYEEDYKALEGLKALTDKYRVGLLVTHHQRKASAEDVFDTMIGSGGTTGGVDNLWILARQRGRADAVLHATGRDIEQEQELALKWDPQLARFSVLGDAAAYRMSLERQAVLDEVRAAGDAGIGPKDVAEALGVKYNVIKQRMYQMSQDGTLRLLNRGRYVVGVMSDPLPHTNLPNLDNLTNQSNLPNLDTDPSLNGHGSHEKVSDDPSVPNLSPNLKIAPQCPESAKVSKVSEVSTGAGAVSPRVSEPTSINGARNQIRAYLYAGKSDDLDRAEALMRDWPGDPWIIEKNALAAARQKLATVEVSTS